MRNSPASRSFYVKTARPVDEVVIRKFLREAHMRGAIQLSLQREPDANIAAEIEGRKHVTVFVINCSDDQVLAIGSRSVRSMYINGKVHPVGYLSQMRVKPGRNGIRRLRAGFEAIEQTRNGDEFACDITSIIEDNSVAVRMLERGLAGLPQYRLLTRLTTFVIPASAKTGTSQYSVKFAGNEDLYDIASCLQNYLSQYQFSPYWDEQMLLDEKRCNNLSANDFLVIRNAGNISSCLAIWDQRKYKQIIVKGYARAIRNIRPFLNLLLFAIGKPRLPKAPCELNMAYVSHMAVTNDDPEAFRDLIKMARLEAARRGIDYLSLGLSAAHPLHRVMSASFPSYQYTSNIYTVHWDSPAEFDDLDARIPHVEVAVL